MKLNVSFEGKNNCPISDKSILWQVQFEFAFGKNNNKKISFALWLKQVFACNVNGPLHSTGCSMRYDYVESGAGVREKIKSLQLNGVNE